MLIILGESGSGKTTLQKYICNHTNMKKAISHTTRPMRNGEVNGIDYYFVNDNEFKKIKEQNMFAETSNYREWRYGIGVEQIKEDSCFVSTPEGLEKIKKFIKDNKLNISLKTIYLKTHQKTRLINLINTRNDTMEILRREFSDKIMFSDIEKKVDYVIYNDYIKTPKELFNQLLEDKIIG